MASVNIKNPYPGFEKGYSRPFTETDNNFFFGREDEIDLIKEKLRQNRFMALLSSPNAGATSILKAGLSAQLKQNNFRAKNGSRWNIAYLTPTDTPLQALARSLSRPGILFNKKVRPDFEDFVYKKLTSSENGLIHLCEESEVRKTSNILLLIDDFNECFNDEIAHQERDRFYNLLLNAAEAPNIAFYVVPCMKLLDVHHSHCRNYPLLLRSIRKSQHQLYALEETELIKAITEPAKRFKVTVVDEVCENLIKNLGNKEDIMSQLQRIMHKIWFDFLGDNTKTEKNIINLKYYYKITGNKPKTAVRKRGVKKEEEPIFEETSLSETLSFKETESDYEDTSESSIEGKSEKVYSNLSANDKKIAAELFKLLTEYKDGKYQTRELAPETIELALGFDLKAINSVTEKFSFIIKNTSSAVSLKELPVIQNWKTLSVWAKEEKENIAFFLEITQAAIKHYIDGEPIESIWDKDKFHKANQWKLSSSINEYRAGLYGKQYDLAMDFLTKGFEELGVKPQRLNNTRKTASPKQGAKEKISLRQKIKIGSGKEKKEDAAKPSSSRKIVIKRNK